MHLQVYTRGLKKVLTFQIYTKTGHIMHGHSHGITLGSFGPHVTGSFPGQQELAPRNFIKSRTDIHWVTVH